MLRTAMLELHDEGDGKRGDGDSKTPLNRSLTLQELLLIAMVPAMVPALVLLFATGLADGMGVLPPAARNLFEQIAGGALLITYMKEIFPQVVGMFDDVVDELGPTTAATRRGKHRRWLGILSVMLVAMLLSTTIQAAAEGFPGTQYVGRSAPAANQSCAAVTTKKGRSTDSSGTFTPGDTLPYFIGFFVDGVCLAYDDNPIALDSKLMKRLILSAVLAVDNLLDAFGIVPLLRIAFGSGWLGVMIAFAVCVMLGAACTALLRFYVSSPLVHLAWFAFSTLSLLDGGLELATRGLSLYVMLGVVVVWYVLVLGDLCDDENVAARDDEMVRDEREPTSPTSQRA